MELFSWRCLFLKVFHNVSWLYCYTYRFYVISFFEWFRHLKPTYTGIHRLIVITNPDCEIRSLELLPTGKELGYGEFLNLRGKPWQVYTCEQ